MTQSLYTLFMSNQKYHISITSEANKPVFIIKKGEQAVGRFLANLADKGNKSIGSAFTAIVMRIVTGFPVNVFGKLLEIDPESIIGDDPVTQALRKEWKLNGHWYTKMGYSGIPMTQNTMYLSGAIENGYSLGFRDPDGGRVSTQPQMTTSKYKVSYSKYAD